MSFIEACQGPNAGPPDLLQNVTFVAVDYIPIAKIAKADELARKGISKPGAVQCLASIACLRHWKPERKRDQKAVARAMVRACEEQRRPSPKTV